MVTGVVVDFSAVAWRIMSFTDAIIVAWNWAHDCGTSIGIRVDDDVSGAGRPKSDVVNRTGGGPGGGT